MFPALFGGGNARLLLTGEEILDCGISLAQPREEKQFDPPALRWREALTAMALVFSISS